MNKLRDKRLASTSGLVKAALLAAISIILTRIFSIMVPLGGLPALRIGFGSLPLIISGMMLGPVIGGVTGIVSDIVGYLMNPQGAYFPGFTLSSALFGILPGLLYKTLKIHRQKFNFNFLNAIMIMIFLVGMVWVMIGSEVIAVTSRGIRVSDDASLYLFTAVFVVAILFVIMPFWMSRHLKTTSGIIGLDKLSFTVMITYILISLLLNTYWLSIMFGKGFLIFLPGRVVAAIPTIPIYTFVLYSISRFINLTDD